MPITSPNNEQLKQIRKLAGRKWRDKTRMFVAEGEDLIVAAAVAGWRPELMLCEAGSGLVIMAGSWVRAKKRAPVLEEGRP